MAVLQCEFSVVFYTVYSSAYDVNARENAVVVLGLRASGKPKTAAYIDRLAGHVFGGVAHQKPRHPYYVVSDDSIR